MSATMEVARVSWWLVPMVGVPWLGAGLVAALGKRQRALAGPLSLAAMVACALALAAGQLSGAGGTELRVEVPWIRALDVRFALRLDAISFPFLVNVVGVAIVALWYALGYFGPSERLHLCYALILAFAGSMVGTLLADDAVLFFVFWESMLVTSSLLLAGWGEGDAVGAVTLKYFIYTQAGSLLLLISLLWLVSTTGSSSLATMATRLREAAPAGLTWIAAAMFVGLGVKLAVAPLHTWLPDAHSIAPMPVTILLAAAMLSMGAYGMLRFPMLLLGGEAVQRLQLPLLLIALASQAYGALMCLACEDIKRLVAYSSVSQMGYVLFALATLTPRGVAGGVFHVLSHGILKALLFALAGIVMRATGRRALRQLGGLWGAMPAISAGFWMGAIAMAGAPPFCAFHSEWMILAGGLATGYAALGYLAFLSPLLTAAYGLWLSARLAFAPAPEGLQIRPVAGAMLWAARVLVALALGVGLLPSAVYEWGQATVEALVRGGAR